MAIYSQNGYYLSYNTGKKKLFYYLSCWKCEALFSGTFWHILLFMVCIFKDVIVFRNYNEWYFMIIHVKETQIGLWHSFILCCYYLSYNTGKKLFYYLSCWKCEALFSGTFWHILLFMVCIFKAVIVSRNYNEWYVMIIHVKETQIGLWHSFILCFEWMFWKLCN